MVFFKIKYLDQRTFLVKQKNCQNQRDFLNTEKNSALKKVKNIKADEISV